jgi:hypothetical protein
MVNVFIKLLLIALCYFIASSNAHANYTPPVKYKLTTTYGGTNAGSKDALCDTAKPIFSASNYSHDPIATTFGCYDNTGQTGQTLNSAWYDVSGLYKTTSGAFTTYTTTGYVIQECGTNTRVSGYPPNVICNGTAPPVCPSGEVSSSGYYDGGKSPTASFPNVTCKDGCSVMFQGTWPHSQSNQADGMHYYAKGSYIKDGFTCSGSTSPNASSTVPKSVEQQAADAAAAQAAADKAAKAAADKAAADAKTAADKAASAAAAQAAEAAKQAAEEAIKKAEASKAAASSTSADPNATQAEKDAANAKAAADKAAADAAKDAAATAVGVAAAAQKDDTKPEPKDFCEKNPTSFICKTSAVNSGYCAPNGTVSGFSCDSDPVFCSMAQTQLQAYCLQNSRDEALVSAYESMKTENGSNSPSDTSKVTNINLPTSLNASSPYGAQCNPDVTVHVASSSVTLPFSAWCPYLNALGYLFLTMAYISAAVIISRT